MPASQTTERKYRTVGLRVQKGSLRDAELAGATYRVIPVVALVEGVLHPSNAPAPELALAEEFGRFIEGWNGRPVLEGHPKNEQGAPVSANSTDLWDSKVVGQLFNSVLDGKKLKSEIWLHKDRSGKKLLDRFESDTPVEVSTGLFADTEDVKGTYQGEAYRGVWRNIVPDHLAILDEGTKGACSIEDGCGAPRMNKDGTPIMSELKTNCDQKTTFQKVMAGIASALKFNKDISDVSRRDALQAALQATAVDGVWCYVLAVFDDVFVYVEFSDSQSKTLRRGYKIRDSGTVVLSAETEEVRSETDFIPVDVKVQQDQQGQSKGDPVMTDAEKVVKDAADAKAAADLKAAADAKVAAAVKEAKEKAEAVAAAEAKTKAEAEAKAKQNASIANYIEAAPEGFRKELQTAVAYMAARKAGLVKALSGKSELSEADLNGLEPTVLEKMCKALQAPGADDITFLGHNPAARTSEERFTPPTPVFPRKAA